MSAEFRRTPWATRWMERFVPAASLYNGDVLHQLLESLTPHCALDSSLTADMIEYVPSATSKWGVVPSWVALSADRWTGVQQAAKALGESTVAIMPMELFSSTPSYPWYEALFELRVDWAYDDLSELPEGFQFEMLMSNELPCALVGESGHWAMWTVAGSCADAAVVSWNDQASGSVRSAVRHMLVDLDGLPDDGRIGQLASGARPDRREYVHVGEVADGSGTGRWFIDFSDGRRHEFSSKADVRCELSSMSIEWIDDGDAQVILGEYFGRRRGTSARCRRPED